MLIERGTGETKYILVVPDLCRIHTGDCALRISSDRELDCRSQLLRYTRESQLTNSQHMSGLSISAIDANISNEEVDALLGVLADLQSKIGDLMT